MYSDCRKNIPKMALPRPKPTMLAPVGVRLRKKPSGTSGAGERFSITAKAPIKMIESVIRPTVCAIPSRRRWPA